MSREPITTIEQLNALDSEEIVEGYWGGFKGEPEPGDNHSLSFWHGWRNGAADRSGVTDDAQRKLAHAVVEASRQRQSRLMNRGRTRPREHD